MKVTRAIVLTSLKRLVLGSLLVAASPPTAQAAWPDNGHFIGPPGGTTHHITTMELSRDADGNVVGWYLAPKPSGSTPPSDILTIGFRVFADGTLHANWDSVTQNGMRFGVFDGEGGLWKTSGFQTGMATFGRVPRDGGFDPSWPSPGTKVVFRRPNNAIMPRAVSDGAGGLYAASSVTDGVKDSLVVFRLLPEGSLAPGWPAEGVLVNDPTPPAPTITYNAPPWIIPDGAGGVVTAWFENDGWDAVLKAQRVSSGATVDPLWPVGGRIVAVDGHTISILALLPSAPDHAFIAWTHDSAGTGEVRLQRIALADGSIAAGWPADGIQVFAGLATSSVRAKVIGDRADGVLMAAGVQRAIRIQCDGTPAPGWPATGWPTAGRSLVDAGAAPSSPFYAVAASPSGFLVAWSDPRPPSGNRVRWLLPDGSPDPTEPDTGRVVSVPPQFISTGPHAILSDGQAGAVVGWENYQCCMGGNSYWVGRISSSVVDVPATSGRPRLALHSLAPNPARDAITLRFGLESDAPARLELLDVAGRRLRHVEILGGGERSARFDGLRSLDAGLYLVRLTQGGASRTAKVALIH